MPRLIVLNGPPGCGKSTLARRYVEEHPPALNLDIDRVRELIGGWRDAPGPADLLARAISLAAARTHLAAGHDVVIPQYLGRPAFLEQLDQLATETGAGLHEIVLMDSKDNALRRFSERTELSADPAHRDAQEMLDRAGGLTELAAMYDRLHTVIATRPRTVVIPNPANQPEAAYARLLAALT